MTRAINNIIFAAFLVALVAMSGCAGKRVAVVISNGTVRPCTEIEKTHGECDCDTDTDCLLKWGE
jgi:hypothetical protein